MRNNLKLIRTALLVAVMGFSIDATFSVGVAHAADVLVMNGETRGQGVLRKRGNECLVITPAHVISDTEFSEITLTLPDRQIVTATLLEVFAEDLAVLRPASGVINRCKDKLFKETKVNALLNSFSTGTLRRLETTGDTALFKVLIEGFDQYKSIRVSPKSANQPIKQGYSGSLLYVNRQLVGMLQNVDAKTGQGFVIQAAAMDAILDPFFASLVSGNQLQTQLDEQSRFLLPTVSEDAGLNNLTITDGDYDFKIAVETQRDVIESDTDFLVRYSTSVDVLDTARLSLLSKKLSATGNSFVSVEKAEDNAKALMIEQYQKLRVFDRIF